MTPQKYMVTLEIELDPAEYSHMFGLEPDDVSDDIKFAVAENAHSYLRDVGCTGVKVEVK